MSDKWKVLLLKELFFNYNGTLNLTRGEEQEIAMWLEDKYQEAKNEKKTDIWLYIIVGLMCGVLFLAIATAIYGIINPSNEPNEYERGYMDGFRDGMLMHDIDYGTIKLEGGEK